MTSVSSSKFSSGSAWSACISKLNVSVRTCTRAVRPHACVAGRRLRQRALGGLWEGCGRARLGRRLLDQRLLPCSPAGLLLCCLLRDARGLLVRPALGVGIKRGHVAHVAQALEVVLLAHLRRGLALLPLLLPLLLLPPWQPFSLLLSRRLRFVRRQWFGRTCVPHYAGLCIDSGWTELRNG
jgi:hypothetical protein